MTDPAPAQSRPSRPLVFISHSRRDEDEKDQLIAHLDGALQERAELWWHDKTGAGDNWRPEIEEKIEEAQVAVLLITSEYLSSKLIRHKEVPAILKAREVGKLRVIPVIGKACAWRLTSWLEPLNVRPKNGAPVWRPGGDPDRDLADIAREVAWLIGVTEKEPWRRLVPPALARRYRRYAQGIGALLLVIVTVILAQLGVLTRAGNWFGSFFGPSPTPLPTSTLTSTPSPATLPSATPTAVPTATATRSATALPAATRVPTHTALPVPPRSTATHTAAPEPPTSTPTRTAIPVTPTDTPAPTGTPTLAARWLPAPELLAPENGAQFTGWNAEVILQWSDVGALRDDEYYVVSIPYDAAGNTATFWRKGTTFTVPSNFSGDNVGFPDRHYNWTVQVQRCTSHCAQVEDDNVRKEGMPLGSLSAEGLFYWHSDVVGRPAPTPTPEPTRRS